MNKKLAILSAAVMMAGTMAAQTVVKGRVTDKGGHPIVGASVKAGNKVVAISDENGNFTISKLPAGVKKVSVAYIGMEPSTVDVSGNMSIVLAESNTNLDEVMVVAYGTTKKSSFTGSAAEIKASDISDHVTSTATSALVGKVAGIQTTTGSGGPGSAPTIRVRGIGSISANSSPLYIVDGAPYEAGIANINPSDIESLTVLKDASASAIYGARGANGVVIITTKKAKLNRDAEVNFEARWGSNSRLVPQYDVISDPAQYFETHYKALYNSKFYNGATPGEAYAFADKNLLDAKNGGLGYQIFTVPAGEKLIGTNFRLNPNATLGYSDGKYFYTPDNWYDETFHNSFRQEYNINVNGATDRFNYYASFGFLGDGGFVNNSDYQRYTGRTNMEYQVKPWLKLTTNMGFTHSDSRSPQYTTKNWGSSGNLFYVTNSIAPIYPLYVRNANGEIMRENGRIVYDAGQTAFQRANITGNAVRDNEYNISKSVLDVFTGKWSMVATPLEGLALSATLNTTAIMGRSNDLSSRFANASGDDGTVVVESTRKFSVNQQYMANYNTTFGGVHNLAVLAGYEQYNIVDQELSGYNDHLFNPNIPELNNAHGKEKRETNSKTDRYMTMGFIGRVNYDFQERYFLSASYRRDASSVFAPGHRWGDFGSLGAAWQLMKEDFMKSLTWLNNLKVRVSYGVQGNDGLGSWHAYAKQYRPSYNSTSGEYSIKMTTLGNDNLTWETSKQWTLGADFSMFNYRLSGSLEYYNRLTSDMLYDKDLPLSSALSVSDYPTNLGEMVNRGVEFSLNAVAYKDSRMQWDVFANITHNYNEITDLGGEVVKGGSSILKEGTSRYEAYLVKSAGIDPKTGKELYYKDVKDAAGNVTGQTTTDDISAASYYECGTTLPSVFGGFGTSISGYGFDLSMNFSYQLGGKIYDGQYQTLMHNGRTAGLAMHKDLLKAWTPDNRNTDIPRLSTGAGDFGASQTAIDRFLTSSDYLTLNNVTLGYTLPTQWLEKLQFSRMRVYVSGENLFLLTARKGLDPRYNFGIGSMTGGSGMAGGSYSGSRTITAGLNITF